MKIKSISTMVLIATIVLITTNNLLSNEANAQEPQAAESGGMKFVGAGLAFGLAALGAGVAIGGVGAAGLAVISERPDLRSQALVFTALGEAVAIYGIVMAIIILGQS
ncbi:MAG TPA: ATP synthase subunit C [Nitrososphaeraceae archaeon]|jgi:V/A-type H+-transporting ATPase subunit K|nr:ATP synthase subunit C [Nitrososphaeraceae archaeon]HJT86053.1 ATP synthase subunit C [Nitrososphaeraceae archaeon]